MRSSALFRTADRPYRADADCVGLRMYLLTIRDGLHTRHIGPYETPKQAADDLDRFLQRCSERARWQIHELEAPAAVMAQAAAGPLPPRSGLAA